MLIEIESVELAENINVVANGDRIGSLPHPSAKPTVMVYDTDMRALRFRLKGDDAEHWIPQPNIRRLTVHADHAAAWDGRGRKR